MVATLEACHFAQGLEAGIRTSMRLQLLTIGLASLAVR